jgi:hypothetical protein
MSYQLSEDTIYYSLVVNYHQTQIDNATDEINRYTNICNKIDSSSFAKSTYNMYVSIQMQLIIILIVLLLGTICL